MNGNSQAVRIPAGFRLETDNVQISRSQEGDLILHPLPVKRGTALLRALRGFDDDYIAELEKEQQKQQRMQDREDL